MDLTGLQTLKQKLLHDKELAPVYEYFLAHFGEHPEFMTLGEQTNHAFVEAVVAQVAQQMFGSDGAVKDLLLARVGEHQFIHGGLLVGGSIGGVIYFEDVHTGLVTVTERRPSIEVKYARFSGRPQPRRGQPSRN